MTVIVSVGLHLDIIHVHHHITSHHTEKTDAGLEGLCIREMTLKYDFIITYLLHYNITVLDALEICSVIVQYFPVKPKLI